MALDFMEIISLATELQGEIKNGVELYKAQPETASPLEKDLAVAEVELPKLIAFVRKVIAESKD